MAAILDKCIDTDYSGGEHVSSRVFDELYGCTTGVTVTDVTVTRREESFEVLSMFARDPDHSGVELTELTSVVLAKLRGIITVDIFY